MSTRPLLLFTVAALALCGAAPALAQDAVEAAWASAEDLYYAGRPGDSSEALHALLDRDDISSGQRVAAYELLASARLAADDRDGAVAAVNALLDVDADYRMNPEMVHPDLMTVYFEVLEDRGALRMDEGIRSVAVLDFGNRSLTEAEAMEPLSWGLADALITALAGATEVTVVERERIDYVLREIELSQSGAVDPETAVRVGKLIGAQSLLLGGFTRMKDDLRIDARLVETETGKILKTRTVDGDVDDLFDLIDELAAATAEDLGSVYERGASGKDLEMKALLEYAQGLRMMNEGKLGPAQAHFQAALAVNPDYDKAARRIRQIEPLLAMGSGDN